MARTALLAGAPFSQEPAFPRELASCPAHDMRPGLPAVTTLFLPFPRPLSTPHPAVSRRAAARSFAFAVADVAPWTSFGHPLSKSAGGSKACILYREQLSYYGILSCIDRVLIAGTRIWNLVRHPGTNILFPRRGRQRTDEDSGSLMEKTKLELFGRAR